MPEYLQTTIDKFTFRVATDRWYVPEGIWILPLDSPATRVRIGVTDFFQQHNGDVAFVNVKSNGTGLTPGAEFAEIETMKVNISVQSPVAGVISAINPALELTPEIINTDPYGDGWIIEVDASNWERDRARLLQAANYLSVMQSQAEEELKS
jgi:glycine cleavage system H protein